MAKRLSQKEKEEIIKSFINGNTLDQLSKEYNSTNQTIARNLKKNLGEEKYKNLIYKNKLLKKSSIGEARIDVNADYEFGHFEESENNIKYEETLPYSSFVEITPLDHEIDNSLQKELSSVPLSEINFPKVVYMVVENKIELEIKLLRDYPEWQFLSQVDLNRKTLKIYYDLKIAKRDCNRDQKVIKVPNPNVFKLVAPILISKGITRLVSVDNLIAL